ncbi:hypothetical protein [Demequina soli]|uniref:hypothetical protein n=1 Tax=Demequina soli TaxID=1638987 RepID=UPI000782AFF9|nr:hypothetical protein [Demequina soli]
MTSEPAPQPEPEPEGAAAPDHAPAPDPAAASSPPPSVLERVRRNRVGALAAGLLVALAAGLLLAILVPTDPNLLALTLLGALLTAAVGFTVRELSPRRGLLDQGAAFVATVMGVHVMAVTGTLDGIGGGLAKQVLSMIGATGPGYDDALLASLASPAFSTGGILCGLAAAIIVGWGPRRP